MSRRNQSSSSPTTTQRQGAWEVPGCSPTSPPRLKGPPDSTQPQCPGTWSPTDLLFTYIPWGKGRQGVLPFTPFSSQQSLPCPSFSFPRSQPLPFSCLTWHLHVFLFLTKVSPSAPELSWRAALVVVHWQIAGVLKGTILHSPCLLVACTVLSANHNLPAFTAGFPGQLPGEHHLLEAVLTLPWLLGLSVDAQR